MALPARLDKTWLFEKGNKIVCRFTVYVLYSQQTMAQTDDIALRIGPISPAGSGPLY